MRTAAAAFALFLGASFPAFADGVGDQAASMCRSEVIRQAHVDASDVSVESVRVSSNAVRVSLNVRINRRLQQVRCDVARGDTLTVRGLSPSLGR